MTSGRRRAGTFGCGGAFLFWNPHGTCGDGVLLIAHGLYRTNDAGKNWRRVLEGDVRTVAVDPSDDHVVYAGTEPVHLYRSEDRGDSWEELGSLLHLPDEVKSNWKSPQPDHDGHIRHIYINPKNSRALYLSLEHGGVVRSFDRGKSWEDVSPQMTLWIFTKSRTTPFRRISISCRRREDFFAPRSRSKIGTGWKAKESPAITSTIFCFCPVIRLPCSSPRRMDLPGIGTARGWLNPLSFAVSTARVGARSARVFRRVWKKWPGRWQAHRLSRLTSTPLMGRATKDRRKPEKMPTGPGAVWFSPDEGNSWREIRVGELPAVRSLWDLRVSRQAPVI